MVEAGESSEEEVTSHNLLDAKMGAARFSMNVMNILDPPKELLLGRWNPRELDAKQWRRLKQSMLEHDLKPYNFENMIPIVVQRRHVDSTCISITADPSTSPLFKLSESGERELTHLVLAGGRHRIQAVKSIREDRQGELKRLQERRKKLQKRDPKGDPAKEKLDREVDELEDEIDELKRYISTLGPWGVILYDEGELISVIIEIKEDLHECI